MEVQREKSDWNTAGPEPKPKPWHAFAEEHKPQQRHTTDNPSKSVRTRNISQIKQAGQVNTGFDTWGFGAESFSVASTASPQISRPNGEGYNSQLFGEAKMTESKPASQPAGWAGF